MSEKKCRNCGKPIYGIPWHKDYCSEGCELEYRERQRKEWEAQAESYRKGREYIENTPEEKLRLKAAIYMFVPFSIIFFLLGLSGLGFLVEYGCIYISSTSGTVIAIAIGVVFGLLFSMIGYRHPKSTLRFFNWFQ